MCNVLFVWVLERQQTMNGSVENLRGGTKRNRRRERRPSRPVDGNRNAAEITNFPQGQEASDFPKDSVPREFGPDPSNGAWAAISSCGAGEERIADAPHSSPLRCSDCAGFVHDLANVVTGISVNAQLLQRKLPPYSRLKRPVVEMERNAQRGGELLKRLLRLLQEGAWLRETAAQRCQTGGSLTVVAGQEPSLSAAVTARLAPRFSAGAAPGFLMEPPKLTLDCDPCTSSAFPKGDDSSEC